MQRAALTDALSAFALASVETAILKDHSACRVAEAIISGDEAEQRIKYNELVDLFGKVKR